MGRTAEEWHRSAVALSVRGRWPGARRDLARAAARTEDVNLRARIAGTAAYILQRTGHPDEAELLCRDALHTPRLSRHTRAILSGQLGALAAHSGRLAEAERLLTRAIAGLADDPVAAARLRMNRSLVRTSRRRLVDATIDLQAAVATFGEHGLTVDEAQARHNLGYASLLAGDLVSALEGMLAARPVAASSPVAGAVCDEDRAEVLRDAGLTTEAERILARTSAVFAAHRMPQSRAQADLNLARSLLTHDLLRARRAATSAARAFRRLGMTSWTARSDAIRLRAELGGGTMDRRSSAMAVGRRAPAAAEVRSVVDALERHGLVNDAAALRMSFLLSRARQGITDDGPLMRRAPRGSTMEVRLLVDAVKAERAIARRRPAEARRHAARGLDTLATWQRDFGSLDLQTSIAMHGSELVYTGLTSAMRSGRPDVLFEWSERARRLSLEVVPLRPPPDESLAEELAELRMLRAESDSNWLALPRAAELHERARQRQWSLTGASTVEERVTLAEVQAALDDRTALIAFVVSRDGLVALVVTDDRTSIVPLPDFDVARRSLPGLRADLDMAASVRTGPLADSIRRSLRDRLDLLSASILDRPAAVAGDRRLVLTVPAVLNGIPWATLRAMRGRAFTVATSATRWTRARSAPTAPPVTAGFAVGPRVVRGQEEVGESAAAWAGATVLTRADVDDVATLAARVDVLHIAAHGRHAVDNPMFSGLELADGALFGYDVDRISHLPATVVLSACEAGRSSIRWGEEAIGMTRVWLHAGTRAVVATPVVVADDDACELLGAMHADLAAGTSPSESLAAASVRTGIVSSFQVHGNGF